MFVRYIGKKEVAFDRLCGTGARWDGPGSVAEIEDAKKAKALITGFPGLYEKADGPEAAPPAPPADPAAGQTGDDDHPILAVKHGKVPLSAANAAMLRAWAKEHLGLQIDAAVSAGEARERIVEHAAALQAEGLPVPGLDDE